MNKYKMISICSLTIACILMLSILLPVRTVANEKESIELSMHYENAEVTANIVVNSEVYTSVVCKYIITDDVYTSEDILAQTRDTGATISLDKSDDDKYTATIKDVNKRFVVIYVSIGNCSLCDYIDCDPGKSSNEDKNEEQPATSDETHNMSVVGEGENGQVVEKTTDNTPEQTVTEQPAPEQQPENQEPAEEPKQEDNNQTPAEQPTENVSEQPVEENNQPAENKNEQIVVNNNNEQQSNDFQAIEEIPSTNNGNENVQNNNQNNVQNNEPVKTQEPVKNNDVNVAKNNTKPVVSNGDKDSIDTSDFEEIEKVVSTSTADDDMPQTGEDDFAKIFGIVVFSCISAFSFYKYKTTK